MFPNWVFTGRLFAGLGGILSSVEAVDKPPSFFSEDFSQWLQSRLRAPVTIPAHRLANSAPLCGAKYVVSMLEIGPRDSWLGLDVTEVAVKWAPNMSPEEERVLRHEFAVIVYLNQAVKQASFGRSPVVSALGWGSVHRSGAIILERLKGSNLRAPLICDGVSAERWLPRPHLRLFYTLTWAVQMAEAITLVHDAGVLHGDIKPENFVFATTPDYDNVGLLVMIDFGAAIISETALREPVNKKGTLPYSSPEHILSFEIYQSTLCAPGSVNPDEEEDEEALSILDELTTCELAVDVEDGTSRRSSSGNLDHERHALHTAIREGKSDVWSFGILLRELFDTSGDFRLFEDFSPTEVVQEMNKTCVPLVTVPESLITSMAHDIQTAIFLNAVISSVDDPHETAIETQKLVSRWVSASATASHLLVRTIRRCLRRRAEARPRMQDVWLQLKTALEVVTWSLKECDLLPHAINML